MNFDPLAKHYTWMEAILAGGQLHRARTAFLPDVECSKSALLIGEGHGRFLLEFCRANPGASVTYLDASRSMLAVARQRLLKSGICLDRINFCASPIQDYRSVSQFDLVATHFFLDCFPASELRAIVENVAAILAPGGKWLLADFQVPAGGWRKWRARCVLASAYAFFNCAVRLRASSLVDPRPLLAANGLINKAESRFNFDLLYAQLWEKPMPCHPSF